MNRPENYSNGYRWGKVLNEKTGKLFQWIQMGKSGKWRGHLVCRMAWTDILSRLRGGKREAAQPAFTMILVPTCLSHFCQDKVQENKYFQSCLKVEADQSKSENHQTSPILLQQVCIWTRLFCSGIYLVEKNMRSGILHLIFVNELKY